MIRRQLLALLLCFGFASTAVADDNSSPHTAWDTLLQKFVRGNGVRYAAWKKSKADIASLDAYLEQVATSDVKSTSKNARIVFYINAYNALAIRSVLRSYPLKSVMDVPGFFDKKKHRVAGALLTLNDIENKKIRPLAKDARVHFAINCASRSCPRLSARAFRAKRLHADLNRLSNAFIKKNVVVSEKSIELNKIFEWYKKDFDAEGGIRLFLKKHAETHEKLDGKSFVFKSYDWRLNHVK